MPRFSVIIPIIKGEFLPIAMQSVLKQTFSDWELILYNDYSPDDIDCILKEYTDSRILYFKGKKNIGFQYPTRAWNKALSFANGEYVCLLGDDDFLSANYLCEMDRIIKKYPNNSVFRSKLERIDEGGNVILSGGDLPEKESMLEFFYKRICAKRIQSTSEFVLRRDDLNKIGGYVCFPRACGSDDATYLTLSKSGGVISTNETVAYWRKSGLNISDNDSEETNNYKLKFLLEWEREFLNNLFCEGVPMDRIYSSINSQIEEILRYEKSFIDKKKTKRKDRLVPMWNSFLNGPLRQPGRRVWYFLRGKHL